jgi:GAF domain-containing protein
LQTKIHLMQPDKHGVLPAEEASPAGDAIEQAVAQARRMFEAGASRHEILTRLATAGEVLAGPGASVSILVLDEDGLLRNGASPNLPPDYLNAIDRLKPDARVGTCAAAAATGSLVITPDFLADDKWAELRHLPRSLGFVGAWSMPIKSPAGAVLGTFGTYYRERRSPTPEERQGVEQLAAVAASVLAGCRMRAEPGAVADRGRVS